MTSLFKKLNNLQLLKLLAIVCLSDGSIPNGKYRKTIELETHKDSIQQHELFNYLSERLLNKKAARYNCKKTIKSKMHSTALVNNLLKLSPRYKTTPTKETKEDYLSEPQPTLKFIFDERKEIQMLAFRMWFDFEGCVIPQFRLAKKLDRERYFSYDLAFLYQIFIAETNPNLVKDLIRLCNNLGFKAVIKKDSRKWSGIDGISIYRKENLIEFTKYGPVTNVRVSKKSPRLSGFTKKSLCLATNDILQWERIHWSFKTKEKALELKQVLDRKLFDTIKQYNWYTEF